MNQQDLDELRGLYDRVNRGLDADTWIARKIILRYLRRAFMGVSQGSIDEGEKEAILDALGKESLRVVEMFSDLK